MSAIALPFNAAAHHHVEGPFFDVSFTPGAAVSNLLTGAAGEVPAYPFLRAIWLRVTSSGGATGTGAPVLDADSPWRAFESVMLADANGAAIVGGIGTFSGYDLYLANKYGGYQFAADPAGAPDFSNAVADPEFSIRIPIEFDDRLGSGSLGNMNANAPFRLSLIGNIQAAIWSTVSTLTTPAMRVRGYLETWTLPADRNLAGIPQEQIPPGGLGTTQYWRKQVPSVTPSSANVTRFTDVGNLIRAWILVARSAAANNSRQADTAWPDPYTLAWDGVPLVTEPSAHRRAVMAQSLGYGRYNASITVGAIEAGVLAFLFNAPNVVADGGDGPNLWLPTLQSTRIEFSGSYGAGPTILEVLTNSVAAVEAAQPFSYAGETGQLAGPAQPSTRSRG